MADRDARFKLIRPDNYDFVTQSFTISPRNYSDGMESSLTDNVEYLHLILTTYISRSLEMLGSNFKPVFKPRRGRRWSSNEAISLYIFNSRHDGFEEII